MRERAREWNRDPEYWERERMRDRERRRDPELRERKREYDRKRCADPEYLRAAAGLRSRKRYAQIAAKKPRPCDRGRLRRDHPARGAGLTSSTAHRRVASANDERRSDVSTHSEHRCLLCHADACRICGGTRLASNNTPEAAKILADSLTLNELWSMAERHEVQREDVGLIALHAMAIRLAESFDAHGITLCLQIR